MRHLRSLWSKITDSAFLTLMIAAGTLLTAFVAYQNERDTHDQVQLLKRQVDLNSSESRPFLRVKPSISSEKDLRVLLAITNPGRIPARVVAYDMLIQLGREIIEPKGGTFNTNDIIYPDQTGLGIYQILSPSDSASFQGGAEPLVVGGCLVYSSISADDPRRWRVSVAYHFDSTDKPPIGLFATEIGVSPNTKKCDASSLREEWSTQLKLYPK
jgi:hypothetical protein